MKHPAPVPVALLAWLLALALLPACRGGGRPTGGEVGEGFVAPDKELVYSTAIDALRRQGYTPDMEASELSTGILVTHWKTSLQPFSGKGYREQATVTIREVPGKVNTFNTETQVIREFNNNMLDPSNLLAAEWGGAQRVNEIEQLINGRIRMAFSPGSLSPRFRELHGLRPAGAPEPPP